MKNIKLLVLSGLGLISVVVIRCIQLSFLIEPRTGFYADGMGGIGGLLSVFAALIVVFAALMGFFSKTDGSLPANKGSAALGCAALLAGLAHLIEPFISAAVPDSVPAVLAVLRMVMIVAAGITFCYFGLAFLLRVPPRFPLMTVLILAFVVRLMSTFVSFTGMSNISENLYDVLMLVMALIFFLFHGKQLCGIRAKKENALMVAVGITAVLLTAISAIPGIVVSLIGTTEVTHTPIDAPLSCLFTAVYISVYLIEVCCLPKSGRTVQSEN